MERRTLGEWLEDQFNTWMDFYDEHKDGVLLIVGLFFLGLTIVLGMNVKW